MKYEVLLNVEVEQAWSVIIEADDLNTAKKMALSGNYESDIIVMDGDVLDMKITSTKEIN